MSVEKTIAQRLNPYWPLPLLIFAWFNPFYHDVLSVLESDSQKVLESLTLLESLYLLASSAASVKLPLVSGTFGGAADTLDEVTQYLSVSGLALLINIMLLKLTNAKVIVAALIIIWLLTFVKKWKSLLWKVMIVGLFFNPGLSLYTKVIHTIDKEVKFGDKDQLHTQLQQIHNDYVQKEELRKKRQDDRVDRQLAKDRAKGRDKLNVFQKAEDAVIKTGANVASHVAEDFKLTKKAIEFAAKKLMVLVVNHFTTILFMYILLPIGYLVLGYFLIKALEFE